MIAKVLAFPDQNKPFIIYSDASYYCTWAILSQQHEIEGKIQERPIVCVAYWVSSTQSKCAVIEKEAYAVYHVVQRFHPYIYIYIYQDYTEKCSFAFERTPKM